MSKWLQLAQAAEPKTKTLTDNRQEPAKRGEIQPKADFLPVVAGLPVGELERGLDESDKTKPDAQISANPKAGPPKSRQSDDDDAKTTLRFETSSYGQSIGGRPLTYTGKVVSLDAWRELSEWEKHGPNGRHWNEVTGRWEEPEH